MASLTPQRGGRKIKDVKTVMKQFVLVILGHKGLCFVPVEASRKRYN